MLYKTIEYGKMLYETLGNYFSVNVFGNLSILYRFLLSCLYTLQPEWDSFETWRFNKKLIANCKWQIGQLTNVLNYYFDNTQKRIYITQRALLNTFAPTIAYESVTYSRTINDTTSFNAGDTLIVNAIYQVNNAATATYNGLNYTQGQFFKVISGITTFTTADGATVIPSLFAPTITDISVLSEVFIWVPASIFADTAIMLNLTSIIEQIKITGIEYEIKPIP